MSDNAKRGLLGTLERLVMRRKMRKIEHNHGFPCGLCGAKTFEEAGNLCTGEPDCPGDSMSKEIFDPHNA